MSSKEVFTLVIRSSKVSSTSNSGTRVNGKYRVNWSQILPTKYRRFKVSSHFRSSHSTAAGAFNSTATICVHTNLTASSSYETLTEGRTSLLCVTQRITNYINTTINTYHLANVNDNAPIVIDYPFESFLNIVLYDINGTTPISVTDLDKDFILTLSFEGIEE